MGKIDEFEAKLRQFVQSIHTLQRENSDLKREVDSLKSHLSLFNQENSKAQKILADYDLMRRKQEGVAQRVERALQTLNTLRS